MGVYLIHPIALSAFRPIAPYTAAGHVILSFLTCLIGVLVAAKFAPNLSAMLLGTPRMPAAALAAGKGVAVET